MGKHKGKGGKKGKGPASKGEKGTNKKSKRTYTSQQKFFIALNKEGKSLKEIINLF